MLEPAFESNMTIIGDVGDSKLEAMKKHAALEAPGLGHDLCSRIM
jgi:hypothetical protein